MKRGFLLKKIPLAALLLLLLTSALAQAQKITVKGTIKDAAGSVMPGVSVLVKGTSFGASTDASGMYSLSVSPDDILVFSFIGYSPQEIKVGNQSTIDVTLQEDITTMDELVVVGYGEMRRSDVTGAMTSVSSKELNRTVNTTIEQALQGRAAGVYVTQNTGAPGGGVSVNIRGVSSINGGTEPLYVIDGVQIQTSNSITGTNPLSTLNPKDIESMEILQGPSATAIYGSRATNGVVLITTKRGKSGEMSITYGYSYSLQDKPKNLDVMNLQEYAQMHLDIKNLTDPNSIRDDFRDPSLLGSGTDWQQALFQRAAMQQHQISLSGGTEKSSFYLSGERTNQDGIGLASGFKRSSVRLNNDNKVRDWFSIGTNMMYAQTDQELGTMGTGTDNLWDNLILNSIRLSPDIPVRNADGTFGAGNPDVSNTQQFSPPNPVGLAKLVTNKQTNRNFMGGINAGIKIWKGLEFRTSFNTNVGFTNSTLYNPTYRFSAYQQNEVATLVERANLNTYWGWNQTLSYVNNFGNHRINVMVTHEAQESKWKNLSASRQGFQTNNILDLNVGDASTAANAGGQGPWAMESYLGRINYNYNDRYIVTAAFRTDGSINFAPKKKWGSFPSIAAAYRISNEPFFTISEISDLRLRFETGITGNQGDGGAIYGRLNSGISPWGTSFSPAIYPNILFQWEETKTNNFGITVGMLNNRIQLEADYYIKNTDNLSMQDAPPWYMGTSGTAAILAPYINIGTLQNKGWSLTLTTVNYNSGDFKWESNFNISSVKPKVRSLANDSATYDRILGMPKNNTPFVQRTMVGYAPWQFIGNVQQGVFTDLDDVTNSPRPVDSNGNPIAVGENGIWVGDAKYKDMNGDGKIDENDLTVIGNPWPKLFGGFTNTFSYRGIELSVLITYSFGADIYNLAKDEQTNPNNMNVGRNMFVGASDYAKIDYDGEGNPYVTNPNTSVPRIQGSSGLNNNYGRYTSAFVEDGSYVRIKNIALNYTLPTTLIQRAKVIRSVRVGASVQNIYTFTKYTGYDPEVGSYVGRSYNGHSMLGVDYGRYPITPVYSFNVGIDF